MALTPEQAYEELLTHEAVIRAAKGSNEANTRSRAIDTILYDVLGWDRRDVDHEKYVRQKGFADYALMDGGAISLMLEAKKAGKTFVCDPVKDRPQKPLGFPLLANESPSAEEALRQAMGYAAAEGAQYVAITNGHQWILTLAYVHKQPIEQRSVFVFDSIDYIKDKAFRLFWNCFSQEGIRANRAATALLEVRKAPAPPKASQYIPGYPVPAERNSMVNELSMVVKVLWDEIKNDEQDERFLSQCYVEPDANASSLAIATQLVQRKLSADEQIRLNSMSATKIPSQMRSLESEKPIIVLGKVGHGKTTFLRYLRLVRAKQLLNKYIQLDINFLARPSKSSEVADYIHKEIDRQLKSNYNIDILQDNIARGALYTDIERFKTSTAGKAYFSVPDKYSELEVQYIQDIQKDKHDYLAKVLRHLSRSAKVF